MSHPIISGEQIWCPFCTAYVHLLRIQRAAKLADVNRRTIYRYIEGNKIYAVKVAGKSYRVCSGCLLKYPSDE
jgi:excisionase family DNA binding protein